MRQRVSRYRLPMELWFHVYIGGYWSYPIECRQFYLQTFHISFNSKVYRLRDTRIAHFEYLKIHFTAYKMSNIRILNAFAISFIAFIHFINTPKISVPMVCKLQCMHVKIIKIRIKFQYHWIVLCLFICFAAKTSICIFNWCTVQKGCKSHIIIDCVRNFNTAWIFEI